MNEIKGFYDDHRFLSNFWYSTVWFEGLRFPTVEHAYQAAKLIDPPQRLPFIDNSKLIKILSPGEAKRKGNSLKLRDDWEEVKFEIMISLVFDKFYRNGKLRQKLIDTGDAYLEETNRWHDNYWGVCICAGCQGKFDLLKYNNLGKILMKVREFWK